jgi:putative transposase
VYRWKAKYGGLPISEAKRLRQLEDENRRLKHVVADLTLDNQALKGLLGKVVTPAARRHAAQLAGETYGLSERRASRLVGVPRSTVRYRARRTDPRRSARDFEPWQRSDRAPATGRCGDASGAKASP